VNPKPELTSLNQRGLEVSYKIASFCKTSLLDQASLDPKINPNEQAQIPLT